VERRNLTIGGYMPFYKREDEQLQTATTVAMPEVTLTVDNQAQHTYPVNGWYWFDTLDEALNFYASKADVTSITPRQARLKLLELGLLDALENTIKTNRAWEIEWEYATSVKRDSPLIGAVASVVGLTDDQIDTLFAEASLL
jgi:hypothetical protein